MYLSTGSAPKERILLLTDLIEQLLAALCEMSFLKYLLIVALFLTNNSKLSFRESAKLPNRTML